jgi:hypothetical protein
MLTQYVVFTMDFKLIVSNLEEAGSWTTQLDIVMHRTSCYQVLAY